jgi:nitrile hydratase
MSTGYHDYGGKESPEFEKVTHDPTFWEQRIDALLELLGDPRRRLMRLDEFRWMNETMGAEDYERLTYYERWVHSITRLMIKKGVVTREEIDARMNILRDRGSAPK